MTGLGKFKFLDRNISLHHRLPFWGNFFLNFRGNRIEFFLGNLTSLGTGVKFLVVINVVQSTNYCHVPIKTFISCMYHSPHVCDCDGMICLMFT